MNEELKKKLKIGFIGQGWIGKNYADDFEERGYNVVRYGLEKAYINNKDEIRGCDYVFIAVPTPTTKKGFDYSAVSDALSLVGDNSVAIIKSTMSPGSTDELQAKYKNIIMVHSPEFLREASAAHDARNPERNIIGLSSMTKKIKEIAANILSILPKAKHEMIMSAKEAELVKYAGNCYLYTKVVFFNMLNDLAIANDLNFENIRNAVAADSRIGEGHTKVVHNSGHTKKKGRGAGGHCFIKDYEAFLNLYASSIGKDRGYKALKEYREKNNELLVNSDKDLDLLSGVIGDISKYKF